MLKTRGKIELSTFTLIAGLALGTAPALAQKSQEPPVTRGHAPTQPGTATNGMGAGTTTPNNSGMGSAADTPPVTRGEGPTQPGAATNGMANPTTGPNSSGIGNAADTPPVTRGEGPTQPQSGNTMGQQHQGKSKDWKKKTGKHNGVTNGSPQTRSGSNTPGGNQNH